jgi:arylformamidase
VYVDLTIPLVSGTSSYPGEPGGFFLPFARLPKDEFTSHQLVLYTHLGTHVDAPSHFLEGEDGVDALPIDSLVGDAMVVRALRPLDGREVMVGDLHWPRPARPGDRVLFDLKWGERWGQDTYFHGHPDLSRPLVEHLVASGVRLVGVDTPTLSTRHVQEVHRRLLGAGVVVIEGLVRLDRVSADFGHLICLPLPLVGLDGSPARVVLEVGEDR